MSTGVPAEPAAPLHLVLPAERASVERARQALAAYLAPCALTARVSYRVELALEEALMNVLMHAYGDRAPHPVGLDVAVHAAEIELTITDAGPAFDPLQVPDPPQPATLDEARPGGLGLGMLRRTAARLGYERRNGRNRLTIGIARR